MANDGRLGDGTVLKFNGSVVNGVTVIPPFKRSKPPIETTNYGSGGYQDIEGNEKADAMSFTIQYNPADVVHAAILAAYLTKPQVDSAWRLEYPYAAARNVDWSGRILDWSEVDAIDNVMTVEFTASVKVSSIAYS